MKKEIINIVSVFNHKPYKDVHGISMAVVKRVMIDIVNPITYIANQSLSIGVFPNKPKLFLYLRKVLCTM